ncbi:META domain-containing protein [Psychrobacter jeotgali]|uniref:META domain-containing protein n=1 Tax=Psychrobacter jeotgali TaxID=179010 RepID=UPI00191B7A13|nr:DUF4377 domain-containing protein [Psychrobacter jeotgali]
MLVINRKLNLKVALLPSLLVGALVLSACSDPAATSETDAEAADEQATLTANSNESGVEQTDTTGTESVSNINAEQQMIDKLARYRWTLVEATDNEAQPLTSLLNIKDQVTLKFNQSQGRNAINYSVGCNTMSALYQLQNNKMTAENSMSTKMSCGELNVAEDRLNKMMQGVSQLTLTDGDTPTLKQVTSDSATLVWGGEMTAQAKYNSKGETVFWAVDANTKPCTQNSTEQCLQIKPITYDDQGLKVSEGEWTEFVGDIEGYQHDGQHDEVLRLQRYKLNNTDTTAAIADDNYAYVLDTVIESAVVK